MDRSLVEKEPKSHGTSTFPFAVYDNYERYPDYSKTVLYLHWHEEAELLHVIKGAARVQINDNESVLREGDIACVPCGAIHTAVATSPGGFCFKAAVFSLNFLTSGISDVTQLQYINRLKLGQFQLPIFVGRKRAWERRVALEFTSLLEADRERRMGFEMAVKGALFKIFSELVAQGAEVEGDSHRKRQDLDRLKLVIQYIHANYSQRLSLNDMAALSNFSKYYFCRFFKAAVGKSPIDYLHYYRLLKAEQLLRDTNLKIIDIAYEVGF